MSTKCVAVTLLCFVVCTGSVGQVASDQQPSSTASQPKPGEATGNRIGNAISAAITTAFPAAQKIIDVIWPNRGTNSKKPEQAKPPLDQAHANSVADQNHQVEDLKQIASELATIRTFLGHCVNADEEVTAIQSILGNKTTLKPDELRAVRQHWSTASLRIGKLGSEDIQKQIDSLRNSDTFVQQTLTAIAQTNLGLVQTVTDNLKDPVELDRLRTNLADVKTKLNGVTSVAGIVLGDISLGLNSLPDKIKGAQSALTVSQQEQDDFDLFTTRLRDVYPR